MKIRCFLRPTTLIKLCQPCRNTRRTTVPPVWLPQKYTSYIDQHLTPENEAFVQELAQKVEQPDFSAFSPLKEEPWPRGEWRPGAKRTGLICRKAGMIPQWTSKGDRILCTLLEVLDNHVINYVDPETWFKTSIIGKRKAYSPKGNGPYGKLTVGALSTDPQQFTAMYRGLFDKAGVMPKKRLASFMVTEDAKLQPGTRLFATHFVVGQHVDVTGRTIDWGFQGGMHRWGMKGQMYLRGQCTKSHRRIGSIGSTGDGKVWVGKKMPGHMGWEWRSSRGLQIVRMNIEEQVIYVRGSVPGDNREIVLVTDSFCENKVVQNPPFPTHYPSEEVEMMDGEGLPREVFMEGLHRFTDPTIQFEEGDYEAEIARQLARARIKKQAKAKRK